MLKFGASQHFQEVSHEPPGTERGEKSVGDEGMGVGVVRTFVYVCCMYVCGGVWGLDERELLGWHGGSMSWVKHGNMDTELP